MSPNNMKQQIFVTHFLGFRHFLRLIRRRRAPRSFRFRPPEAQSCRAGCRRRASRAKTRSKQTALIGAYACVYPPGYYSELCAPRFFIIFIPELHGNRDQTEAAESRIHAELIVGEERLELRQEANKQRYIEALLNGSSRVIRTQSTSGSVASTGIDRCMYTEPRLLFRAGCSMVLRHFHPRAPCGRGERDQTELIAGAEPFQLDINEHARKTNR